MENTSHNRHRTAKKDVILTAVYCFSQDWTTPAKAARNLGTYRAKTHRAFAQAEKLGFIDYQQGILTPLGEQLLQHSVPLKGVTQNIVPYETPLAIWKALCAPHVDSIDRLEIGSYIFNRFVLEGGRENLKELKNVGCYRDYRLGDATGNRLDLPTIRLLCYFKPIFNKDEGRNVYGRVMVFIPRKSGTNLKELEGQAWAEGGRAIDWIASRRNLDVGPIALIRSAETEFANDTAKKAWDAVGPFIYREGKRKQLKLDASKGEPELGTTYGPWKENLEENKVIAQQNIKQLGTRNYFAELDRQGGAITELNDKLIPALAALTTQITEHLGAIQDIRKAAQGQTLAAQELSDVVKTLAPPILKPKEAMNPQTILSLPDGPDGGKPRKIRDWREEEP